MHAERSFSFRTDGTYGRRGRTGRTDGTAGRVGLDGQDGRDGRTGRTDGLQFHSSIETEKYSLTVLLGEATRTEKYSLTVLKEIEQYTCTELCFICNMVEHLAPVVYNRFSLGGRLSSK